ncbi:MAG: histidine kinase, partial [Paenibacillus macerans]|nr:histidine kinase [Paenibacillus macerans]
ELKYRIRALLGLKQSIHELLTMEAAYLQAQIQPHFIFNTLNSIMALSLIDIEKMRKLGDAFATYLKISFDFLNTKQLVELSHELELLRAYLYVEQERFGERLSIQWEIQEEPRLLLPPLTIQPLVENALKHGLLTELTGGTLLIRGVREEGGFRVEVRDNGQGMEPDLVNRLLHEPSRNKRGIGLYNTNQRISRLYGRGLSIRSRPGEGTSVSFFIPMP